VAYFPERYGEELIPLALNILRKKPVPSTIFVKHQLLTPRNVDLIYPLDERPSTPVETAKAPVARATPRPESSGNRNRAMES
jgi:hypothetical protein